MKKLKVLICAFACDPKANSGLGGGEDVLGWNMILQLAAFCDVWVLASFENRAGVEEFLVAHPMPNLFMHYVDLPVVLKRPLRAFWSYGGSQIYSYFWQIWSYGVAKKLHYQHVFDVFHHITYANDWMSSFIGALLPVPYIRGPGGGAHATPKAFLGEYSFKQRMWQYLRSLSQWVLRHDPFFMIGRKRARAILVCNHEAADALPQKYRHKTYLFPVNGVAQEDFDVFSRTKNVVCDGFTVLSVGHLIPLKGFPLAIRAFGIFSQHAPDATLVIVGNGPELKKLRALVLVSGLEKKVVFEPWVPREKILEKMRQCDVFLFTSMRDGGGAVVVEAMAAGKPVVCLDIGGPGFHIDSSCGIKIPALHPGQSIKELANAISRLYSDKELKIALGQGALQKARNQYHWDRLGERLRKIYQEVILD